MVKLTSLKPTLRSLAPTIGRLPGRDAYDAERRTVTWRGWYKLARWKRLRLAIFARDRFTCQMAGCGRIEGNTSLLVADHTSLDDSAFNQGESLKVGLTLQPAAQPTIDALA